MRFKALLLALMISSACAGSRLSLPAVVYQSGYMEYYLAPLDPSRNIHPDEMIDAVSVVDARVVSAAISVCENTFVPSVAYYKDCTRTIENRSLSVDTWNSGVNAFVGKNFDLTLLGGLVGQSGNDDELAFVLAHEYGHALLEHVAKMENDGTAGALIGALAGAAIGGSLPGSDWSSVLNIATESAYVGHAIGSIRFSKQMELEADHIALFIANEAGYNMRYAMKVLDRINRVDKDLKRNGVKGTVGFLETHPSSRERIMNLLATEKAIRAGAVRPKWKQ